MIGNRVSIVKKWPKSASFYAMLGLPVNLYGLEIKNIEVRSGVDEQGARLMVLGVVKNVTNSAKALPYLRITLLDGHKQVATWLVDPNATFIDKGQVVNFQSIRRNPPNGNIKAIAVSYTHLDVYKRQVSRAAIRAANALAIALMNLSLIHI